MPLFDRPRGLTAQLGSYHDGKSRGSVATVRHPTNVISVDGELFVSSFMRNQLWRVQPGRRDTPELFAEGVYCKPHEECAILDGPWGLASKGGFLFVSSFGTDQILVFNTSTGKYVSTFGDSTSLDCPEGIALNAEGSILYVVSFLANQVHKPASRLHFNFCHWPRRWLRLIWLP